MSTEPYIILSYFLRKHHEIRSPSCHTSQSAWGTKAVSSGSAKLHRGVLCPFAHYFFSPLVTDIMIQHSFWEAGEIAAIFNLLICVHGY